MKSEKSKKVAPGIVWVMVVTIILWALCFFSDALAWWVALVPVSVAFVIILWALIVNVRSNNRKYKN